MQLVALRLLSLATEFCERHLSCALRNIWLPQIINFSSLLELFDAVLVIAKCLFSKRPRQERAVVTLGHWQTVDGFSKAFGIEVPLHVLWLQFHRSPESVNVDVEFLLLWLSLFKLSVVA